MPSWGLDLHGGFGISKFHVWEVFFDGPFISPLKMESSGYVVEMNNEGVHVLMHHTVDINLL